MKTKSKKYPRVLSVAVTAQPVFTSRQEIQTATAEVGAIGITVITTPPKDRAV